MNTRIGSHRNPLKKQRPSSLTIPERAGPHVRLVFEEMRRQGVTYDRVEEMSGVLRATVKAWRHRTYPHLMSIEAVLGCLGWYFLPVPQSKALPPDLAAALAPIAERFGLTAKGATESLIILVAGIHGRFPAEAAPPTAPALDDLATDSGPVDVPAKSSST